MRVKMNLTNMVLQFISKMSVVWTTNIFSFYILLWGGEKEGLFSVSYFACFLSVAFNKNVIKSCQCIWASLTQPVCACLKQPSSCKHLKSVISTISPPKKRNEYLGPLDLAEIDMFRQLTKNMSILTSCYLKSCISYRNWK